MNVNRLKGLMAEKNVKQKDLAVLLNITPTAVGRKLKDKSAFSIEQLIKISKYLKVDINIFL